MARPTSHWAEPITCAAHLLASWFLLEAFGGSFILFCFLAAPLLPVADRCALWPVAPVAQVWNRPIRSRGDAKRFQLSFHSSDPVGLLELIFFRARLRSTAQTTRILWDVITFENQDFFLHVIVYYCVLSVDAIRNGSKTFRLLLCKLFAITSSCSLWTNSTIHRIR